MGSQEMNDDGLKDDGLQEMTIVARDDDADAKDDGLQEMTIKK